MKFQIVLFFVFASLTFAKAPLQKVSTNPLIPSKVKLERAPGQEDDSNCFIKITHVLKTDEVENEVFPFKTKTKSECGKIAESFKPNFAPQIVMEKTVEFEWSVKR